MTCTIRDLTAQRTISDVRTLTIEGDDAFTATTPCWISLTAQKGHRYRATVRVWRSERAGAPLATAVRDYEHTRWRTVFLARPRCDTAGPSVG